MTIREKGTTLYNKIPPAAWVCITLAFLGVCGAFVALSIAGSDATEFRSFLNTVMNLAGLLLGGGALAFAGQAAKQTNGGLDQRIKDGAKDAVIEALAEQRNQDTRPGGVFEGGAN